MNFVRYPFCVVNFLFMALGITTMALGILLLTNYSILEDMLQISAVKNSNFSDGFYRSEIPVALQPSPAPQWLARIRDPASYLLTGLGAFYFTLSFIGYCGSIKDSRGLMIIYAMLLLVLFVLEVVGVFLYLKYKPDLKTEMATAISKQYKTEETQRFSQFEFIMDFLMINYKCCGVNSERDFKEVYENFYSVRSLSIDPRKNVKDESEESLMKKDIISESFDARVVTGSVESSERQVPVSCCKLNITSSEAVKLLQNIYRKQEDKLQLLDFAIDSNCVTKPDETNAYVGDSHGCFDKIQGEISTPLRIGMTVVGMVQLCGLVFAGFIFKTAYYDWLG